MINFNVYNNYDTFIYLKAKSRSKSSMNQKINEKSSCESFQDIFNRRGSNLKI